MKGFSVMVLPLLGHTLLATGTFWTLISKIGNSLPSVLRIGHLFRCADRALRQCVLVLPSGRDVGGKSAWTALILGEHRTLAIRHMEMCLLGSCSQLQLMSLGPGWDCQPLG